MMIRKAILLAILVAACSPVFAAGLLQGTPQEQAACRPDVRKFCYAIAPGSNAGDFLACLQAHRSRLAAACRALLESHGQ
jgi:hypothetical protein